MRLQPPTADSARQWAERGMQELWDDLQGEKFPMDSEQVGKWMRAAYGRGYVNALTDPDEAIVLDAIEHNSILQILVPIT